MAECRFREDGKRLDQQGAILRGKSEKAENR